MRRKFLSATVFAFSTFVYIPSHAQNDLIGGKVTAETIKLDIDEFEVLSHGVCIVKKGDKQALIDMKGNFVVPWGKYVFEHNSTLSFGGFFIVRSPTYKYGMIDTKGNVVIPLDIYRLEPFNHYMLAEATKAKQALIEMAITEKGTEILKSTTNYYFNNHEYARHAYKEQQDNNHILWLFDEKEEEVVPIGTPPPMGKSGRLEKNKKGQYVFISSKLRFAYANRNGKKTLVTNYDKAREFTEGLAAVMKKDEFGVDKWGYIDTTGKLVIPLKFQYEPGYFHQGLALVQPYEKTDFDFAYIDREGQVKFTIGDGAPENRRKYVPIEGKYLKENPTGVTVNSTPLWSVGYFRNGYAVWKDRTKDETVLLDMNGKFKSITDIASGKDLTKDGTGIMIDHIEENGIYFLSARKFITRNKLGLIGFDGKVIYNGVFSRLYPDYFSSYAIASVENDYNEKGAAKEGIIDSTGNFIMIKANEKTW